jgi:hypothetical protein
VQGTKFGKSDPQVATQLSNSTLHSKQLIAWMFVVKRPKMFVTQGLIEICKIFCAKRMFISVIQCLAFKNNHVECINWCNHDTILNECRRDVRMGMQQIGYSVRSHSNNDSDQWV